MTGERTMGRPPKIHQVLRHDDQGRPVTVGDHVVAAIRAGNYIEQAAATADIDKTTIYDWLRKGARLASAIAQGHTTPSKLKAQERRLLDFSNAVARAEAEWEVNANATLERLSRPRQVKETVTTVEDGKPVKVVTKERTEEADAATIRWRLAHRYPGRYGQQRVEVTGPDGGPIPMSVRELAADSLAKAAAQIAANAAAMADQTPTDPEAPT